MRKLFNKLFISGDWRVCIFEDGKCTDIEPEKGYWYGDPFLVGNNFLFVEAFDKKHEIGKIGFLKKDEKYSKLHLIIEGKNHFSFPNVFCIKDKFYMIPESGEINGIFLYDFEKFPEIPIEKFKISSGHFVDTALIKHDGSASIFLTYKTNPRSLYQLTINFENKRVDTVFLCNDDKKIFRPAGNAYIENGKIFMPFQNGLRKYGESIIIKELEIENGKIILKDNVKEIYPKDLLIGKKIGRIHTLNKLSENRYTCDYMVEHFSLLKPFRMLKRIIRRKRIAKYE